MRVFLSYRRGDAAGHAGRLHDDLVQRLGPGAVFQDVASIAPGERFLDAIERSLAGCDVVLAVIGRRFTEVDPGTGRSRLHDPRDVVRGEIEAALRSGRTLVPVLVDRAALPAAADLPPELAPLLERNAIELRDEAWAEDLQRLSGALGLPGGTAGRRPRWALLGIAAVVVALVVGIVVAVRPPPADGARAGSPTPAALPTAGSQPWPAERTVDVAYSGTDFPGDTGRLAFTVRNWWLVPDGGGTVTVSVRVSVANDTTHGISVYSQLFRLLVDRAAQADPSVGQLGAKDSPAPGQATEHLVVFSRVPPGRTLEMVFGYDAEHRSVILQGG